MHLRHQIGLVQQERPIVPVLGDALRAAQVEVDGRHLALELGGGTRQNGRIVPAELRDERRVLRGGLEVLRSVLVVLCEYAPVEHGREGELRVVASAEQPEGQFALVDHGRHDVLWAAEGRPEVACRSHLGAAWGSPSAARAGNIVRMESLILAGRPSTDGVVKGRYSSINRHTAFQMVDLQSLCVPTTERAAPCRATGRITL
ncbi:flagellar biosynthesis protein FlgC [Babesia caballi]|uniref:Flagellar biosynthesis protein FlgC n=1 Tax=Babesia caballi TaxID=5871 RepID=A0AAV4M161_BABCB|nr:flagellar biosynthesis protein FlgC [Babesia caballi]